MEKSSAVSVRCIGMPDPQSPDPHSLVRAVSLPSTHAPPGSAGRVTLAAAALFALAGSTLSWQAGYLSSSSSRRPVDRCALPAGVTLADLQPAERADVTRRALLCADVEHGRISPDAYRAALAALDANSADSADSADATGIERVIHYSTKFTYPAEPIGAMVWAAGVRAMSSQYATESWSAAQVLGPPDVPAGDHDHINAWASRGADDQEEFLEVSLHRPVRASAVHVYETYNPGAVTKIELIGESGRRQVLVGQDLTDTSALGHLLRVQLPCTAELGGELITAVRVTLDSQSIEGWNEIDSIGVESCEPTEQ